MYILFEPGEFFELSFNPEHPEYLRRGKVQKPDFNHFLLDPGIYYACETLIIVEDGKIKVGVNPTGEPFEIETSITEERECGEDIVQCIKDYLEELVEEILPITGWKTVRRTVPRYEKSFDMSEDEYAELIRTIKWFLREVQKLKRMQRGKTARKRAYTALELLSKYRNR